MTLEQFIEDALCSISNDKTYTLNITKEACEAIKDTWKHFGVMRQIILNIT